MPPKPRKPPPPRSGGRNRNLLIAAGAAAIVVIGLVAASLLLRGGDSGSEASTTNGAGQVSTLLDGIPQDRTLLGSSDAKVTMIQFEDLQCPICGRYQQEVFPGVIDEYVKPGKVKLRFVGLAFLGPDSEKALLHVIAAGEQGKLWQFADALYANQGDENSGWVTDDLLKQISGDLGLDYAKLTSDANGPAVLQQANSMAAEGQQRKIPGTPWFYVQVGDSEPYEVQPKSLSIEEFRTILDDALSS